MVPIVRHLENQRGKPRKFIERKIMYSKINVVGAAPQCVLWGIKDGLFGGSLRKYYSSLQAEFDKELFDGSFLEYSESGGDRSVYIKDLVARVVGPMTKRSQRELDRIIKANTKAK